MSSPSSRSIFSAVLGLLAVYLCSCALPTRIKTMNVSIPESTEPETGPRVRISSVTDMRHLSCSPDIAARAFGVKGTGLSSGTIVLPEGRTVADVVKAAVAQGMRLAGYRVVQADDPMYEEALPLEVHVEQFWISKEMETGSAGTYFSTTIIVDGLNGSQPITSETFVKPKGYATLWLLRLDTFRGALKKGMKKLVEDIAKAAASAECAVPDQRDKTLPHLHRAGSRTPGPRQLYKPDWGNLSTRNRI